jgi:integration host factor subunit beta
MALVKKEDVPVAEIEKIMRNDFDQQISQRQGRHVNKLDLIKNLMEECQLTKKESAAVVDLFFSKISDALAEGDRVEIRGLCSFFVKEYKSYQGRNPMTGERVQVAPKRLPFFKIGKELKKRVDY